MNFARTILTPAIAIAGLAAAAPSLAQGYGYHPPGYSYTRPPYSYQPPPYSYTPPSYSYTPPSYSYTPPGYRRPGYRANTPDYNNAYDYPRSAYGPRGRRGYGDPVYNRFGNPRSPTDVYNAAPPYESEGR